MIVGREIEISKLKSLVEKSKRSEFYAVYGRRRVGKTYLVREAFNNNFAFYHTGLANADMHDQLEAFHNSLRQYGSNVKVRPKNWLQAFHQLEILLNQSADKRKVVFIDELPWFDTPRSKFLSALEYFWNGWASARNDIVLIVCGSATSWIIDNLILNYGGLHNRLTGRILLEPLCLGECEQMARTKGIGWSRKDIVEAYMIVGGIPYYWDFFQKSKSLAQNVDNLFFNPTGELFLEFQALYKSLFRNASAHITIVETLSKVQAGMSREDILINSGIHDSGKFNKVLQDLEYCGFIRKYSTIDKKRKDSIYQLIDNYTLFYYRYIAENSHNDKHYWSSSLESSRHSAWSGLAFERVCMQHIEQIKIALGISGVITNVYSWRTKQTSEHPAAQIDILIDRKDNIINLCEAKFTSSPYIMTKKDEEDVLKRVAVFKQSTQTRKTIQTILITTLAPIDNTHLNTIDNVVTMDKLFALPIL